MSHNKIEELIKRINTSETNEKESINNLLNNISNFGDNNLKSIINELKLKLLNVLE